MIVVWLFIAVPKVCLQFVIVLFPDHTHYFCLDCGCATFLVHRPTYTDDTTREFWLHHTEARAYCLATTVENFSAQFFMPNECSGNRKSWADLEQVALVYP